MGPKPEAEQVHARPSQNTCLGSGVKTLASSYIEQATKELEGLRERESKSHYEVE